jgi:hypothetical protein
MGSSMRSSAGGGGVGVQYCSVQEIQKRQRVDGAIEAGAEEGAGATRGACEECVLCENPDN